jgi:hypothetical protein
MTVDPDRAAKCAADVLEACRTERAIERGARGKPWDDDAVWPAYLRAVERRRRAVDAWLKVDPIDAAEARAEALGL